MLYTCHVWSYGYTHTYVQKKHNALVYANATHNCRSIARINHRVQDCLAALPQQLYTMTMAATLMCAHLRINMWSAAMANFGGANHVYNHISSYSCVFTMLVMVSFQVRHTLYIVICTAYAMQRLMHSLDVFKCILRLKHSVDLGSLAIQLSGCGNEPTNHRNQPYGVTTSFVMLMVKTFY